MIPLVPLNPAIAIDDNLSIVQMILNLKKVVENMQIEIDTLNSQIEMLKELIIKE